MEQKQTQKKTTRKTKKTSNVLYHVSWFGSNASYSRTFRTENERDYFIKTYIGNVKVETWESEVNNE